MKILKELWLCVDCTMGECNGDLSGMAEERGAEVGEALKAMPQHLTAHFDSETGEGVLEFGRPYGGCSCCRSPLAGTFHRFAVLG